MGGPLAIGDDMQLRSAASAAEGTLAITAGLAAPAESQSALALNGPILINPDSTRHHTSSPFALALNGNDAPVQPVQAPVQQVAISDVAMPQPQLQTQYSDSWTVMENEEQEADGGWRMRPAPKAKGRAKKKAAPTAPAAQDACPSTTMVPQTQTTMQTTYETETTMQPPTGGTVMVPQEMTDQEIAPEMTTVQMPQTSTEKDEKALALPALPGNNAQVIGA